MVIGNNIDIKDDDVIDEIFDYNVSWLNDGNVGKKEIELVYNELIDIQKQMDDDI